MKWSMSDAVSAVVLVFLTIVSVGCFIAGRVLIVKSLDYSTEGELGVLLFTIGSVCMGGLVFLGILFIQFLISRRNPVVVRNVAGVFNRVLSENGENTMTLTELEAAVRRTAKAMASGNGDA